MDTTSTTKEKLPLILAAAVIILALLIGFSGDDAESEAITAEVPEEGLEAASPASTATYSCRDDKELTAKYAGGIAEITLSDGRRYTFEGVKTQSGGRFASEDNSITFITTGNFALFSEDGAITYQDCMAAGS